MNSKEASIAGFVIGLLGVLILGFAVNWLAVVGVFVMLFGNNLGIEALRLREKEHEIQAQLAVAQFLSKLRTGAPDRQASDRTDPASGPDSH